MELATVTDNEMLQEAQKQARVVYGWGESEYSEPYERQEATRRSGARDSLIYHYAHAIPSQEAVDALTELSPVVELGAGGGYWAYLVQENGGEILPLDVEVESNGYSHSHWTKVTYGDEWSLESYPEHALFLCWPCGDMTAESALAHYKGDTVAYVGEHEGGCCASPGFFALLDRDFTQERVIDIPRFWGMTDYMSIWRRGN